MGAAIEVFEGSRLIEVGRDRFLPVKTTNDLLVLRSDVYDLGQRLRARPGRRARCRSSTSTRDYYKLVGEFDKRFPEGAPSLRQGRRRCVVEGDWTFGDGRRGRRRGHPRRRARRTRRGRRGALRRLGSPAWLADVMPTDRLSTVDEHLERILDVDRAAAAPTTSRCWRRSGSRSCEDVVAPMRAAGLRQLRRWTATPCATATSPTRQRGAPGAPAGRRGDRRPGQTELLALSPGHRGAGS